MRQSTLSLKTISDFAIFPHRNPNVKLKGWFNRSNIEMFVWKFGSSYVMIFFLLCLCLFINPKQISVFRDNLGNKSDCQLKLIVDSRMQFLNNLCHVSSSYKTLENAHFGGAQNLSDCLKEELFLGPREPLGTPLSVCFSVRNKNPKHL